MGFVSDKMERWWRFSLGLGWVMCWKGIRAFGRGFWDCGDEVEISSSSYVDACEGWLMAGGFWWFAFGDIIMIEVLVKVHVKVPFENIKHIRPSVFQ